MLHKSVSTFPGEPQIVKSRIHIATLVLSTIFGIGGLLFSWALSSPVGSSSDEGVHLTFIWCGDNGDTGSCPQESNSPGQQLIPTLIADGLSCQGWNYFGGSSCQLAVSRDSLTSVPIIAFGKYPGLSARVLHKFVTSNVERSVLNMRLFNGFIATVIISPLLLLSRKRGINVGIAVLLVLTPLVTSVIASVNPSSWSLIGMVGCVMGLSIAPGIWKNQKWWQKCGLFTLVALAGAMAWWSRPDTRVMLLAFVGIFASQIWIQRTKTWSANSVRVTRIVMYSLVPLGFLVLYFTRNLLSTLSLIRFVDEQLLPNYSAMQLLNHNFISLPKFIIALIGQTGGDYATVVTPKISQVMFLAAYLFALSSFWAGMSAVSRLQVEFLLVFGVGLILLVHQLNGYAIFGPIQPRYFAPYFMATIVLVGSRSMKCMSKWRVVTIVSLVVGGNSVALWQNLRRWVTGLSEYQSTKFSISNFDLKPRGWWWSDVPVPSPELVWIFGTLSFALFSVVFCLGRLTEPHSSNSDL